MNYFSTFVKVFIAGLIAANIPWLFAGMIMGFWEVLIASTIVSYFLSKELIKTFFELTILTSIVILMSVCMTGLFFVITSPDVGTDEALKLFSQNFIVKFKFGFISMICWLGFLGVIKNYKIVPKPIQ
jgi:hypothetical protein